MVSDAAKQPDEAAMRRILNRYSDRPEGVILRLAWLEGLSRKELNELTWDQVDFETQNLLYRIGRFLWNRLWQIACRNATRSTEPCLTGC